MGVMLEQDKAKTRQKVKSKKSRCIYCRKCYNSGLCLMRWPGFPVTGPKVISKNKVITNAKI
jgi:hypothetical protein